MVELFVERDFPTPLTRNDVFAMAEAGGGCFGLYKIDWIESLLATDGRKLLCHFRAPDAESLRMAFRVTSGGVPALWPGTVHNAQESHTATVLVERRFDNPTCLDELQAIEDKNVWCLETRNVSFERTFFALDRKRMICLYRGPDAESVRQVQQQSGLPVERVWTFQRIGVEDFLGAR